jgi:hypothetical protein
MSAGEIIEPGRGRIGPPAANRIGMDETGGANKNS